MASMIRYNVQLDRLNSFGVPAIASHFAEVRSENELRKLLADQRSLPGRRLVLGGGSNLLFTNDFEGLAIKISIPGVQHEIRGTDVFVTAGGGIVWNDLVGYCVQHGFAGIENLALIPGTAGAAPVQNIGAYGVELMDVFFQCRAFDTQSGEIITLFASECGFTYRDSIFKSRHRERYIITTITLKLSLIPSLQTSYGAIREELMRREIHAPGIADIASAVSAIRVNKLPDPSTIGNAGSFFKNPMIPNSLFTKLKKTFPDIVHYELPDESVKLAAGWMIEQCGWKGKRVGECGTWHQQALVIVNHGRATGREIYELSERIIGDVYQKFGIRLEREVVVI